jgi:hypothetical protein
LDSVKLILYRQPLKPEFKINLKEEILLPGRSDCYV